MTNTILEALKNRRSIKNFSNEPVSGEQIAAILESGRWAPSWLNVQPWKFIVIDDPDIKNKMCESVPIMEKAGVKDAPVCIAVCVESYSLSAHLAEDGAAATLNMSLAAYSLGLGTYWVGIYNHKNHRKSNEAKLKKLLNVPENFRLVSLLPIGVPANVPVSRRKNSEEIVCHNHFSTKKNDGITAEQVLQLKIESEGAVSFAHRGWNPLGGAP